MRFYTKFQLLRASVAFAEFSKRGHRSQKTERSETRAAQNDHRTLKIHCAYNNEANYDWTTIPNGQRPQLTN